jgi:hypothetical protein
MFELQQEKDLLITPDKTVRLTTHRLIHDEDGKRKQLMREDIINYEPEKKNIGNYKLLTIIISVTSILSMAPLVTDYLQNKKLYDSLNISPIEALFNLGNFSFVFKVSFFLLVLSVLLLLMAGRK